MQDRIPLYPGRVTLTAVAGQANTYDMERADSPTQEGTPLNKASLLKDSTATLFGLTDTAVPDDVFQEIAKKNVFEVGDTLQTVRTNSGDKWLLCNGEQVSASDYPDLAAANDGTPLSVEMISSQAYVSDIAHSSDGWVAVGRSTSNAPLVFSTTDPAEGWTAKQTSTAAVPLYCVAGSGGTWAIGGRTGEGVTKIWTDSFPPSSLTARFSDELFTSIDDIACDNGTWVAVGAYNYRTPAVCVATNPTGTWTVNQLSPSSDGGDYTLKGIACYNGTWVAVGYSNQYGLPYVFTTTNPLGTWTASPLVATGKFTVHSVYCDSGVWVAAGCVKDSTNSDRPYIFTTENPAGSWQGKQISDEQVILRSVTKTGNKWKAVGGKYIYTAQDPLGDWAQLSVGGDRTQLNGIANAGSIWAAVGEGDTPTRAFTNAGITLPTISVDGVYTYIKAKE